MHSPSNPEKKWKTVYDTNYDNQNKKPSFLSLKTATNVNSSPNNPIRKESNNNIQTPSNNIQAPSSKVNR